MFSLQLARRCAGLVTSVVVGDDMVPRFGLGAMKELRSAVLAVAQRGDRADTLCTELESSANPSEEARLMMAQVAERGEERLFPAGDMLHIAEGQTQAVRLDQQDLSEMWLSRRMFAAHLPGVYLSACSIHSPSL